MKTALRDIKFHLLRARLGISYLSVLPTTSCLLIAQPPTQRGARAEQSSKGANHSHCFLFQLGYRPGGGGGGRGRVSDPLVQAVHVGFPRINCTETNVLGMDNGKTGEQEQRLACYLGPVWVSGLRELRHSQSTDVVLF